jgi:hypothetical protein
MPEHGSLGPKSLKGSPVTIHLYVEDADAFVARAVAAGAKTLMPISEMLWGDRSTVTVRSKIPSATAGRSPPMCAMSRRRSGQRQCRRSLAGSNVLSTPDQARLEQGHAAMSGMTFPFLRAFNKLAYIFSALL